VFSVLRGECEKIIDTRKLIPDFVFRRTFAKYVVVDHNYICRSNFGTFLFALSNIFADKSVNYMNIAPDPVDCYYSSSGFFGLASFESSSLVERYAPVMTLSRELSLIVGGNVGAFWGSSLQWGIICDRISWEIAVIALAKDVDVPEISGFRCMDASQLSACINNDYSWDPAVASDFNKRFFANYPI
jgi:hypothetical protein